MIGYQETCPANCGAEIKWIKTVGGKNMPVDIKKVTIMTKDGKIVRGHIPHFITCERKEILNNFKK